MKLIIVRNSSARTRSFHMTAVCFVLSITLLFLVFGGLGGGSTYLWLTLKGDNLLTYEGVENWKEVLDDQKQNIESVKLEAERELDALTLRLAELQGRITRLDALGERLTVKAKLNDGEFDFSEPPAVGGPEEPLEISNIYAKPTLIQAIDQLAIQIDNREQQLDLLDSLLTSRTLYSDAFIAGLPVEKGWLSSRFGRRTDPFTGKAAWHNGIDFAGKRGSKILAMAAGVVTWAGDRSGYGMLVEINHGNGYTTRYAHNESINVKVGDIVKRGQTIAAMGRSGRATGYHVHVEVLEKGKKVDPTSYIYRNVARQ